MATRVISTKLAVAGESQYRESLARINGEIKSLQSALKLTESQYQTNANSMAALTAKGDALKNLYDAQTAKVEELRKALANAQNAEAAYAAKKAELTAKIEANNKALEAQDSKIVDSGKSWAHQAEIVSRCEAELEKLRDSTEDTGDAQAALEKKIAAAKEKMAALEDSTGGAARSTGELIAENKGLNSELEKNENYLTAAGRGVTSWKDKLNSAEIKLNDIDAELKLNKEYLEEARNSADGCATSIDRFGERAQSSAEKADELSNALTAAGVVAALKATADALEACVDASVDFESAMAGVSKTTDLADDELAAMGDAIQDLATKIPATASEIANVAEAAGQLGIAKEDILSFSEVMVNLGTATNLSSTDAATALAKFANVVSMSADNYERLGSTIVALGNNFATTEADIVSMATRLASTGNLVGLTESEIMAVATALSSVGIEAEAGGSAVSKLLKQFEVMVQTGSPQLADFAAVAGMSADEFAAAWGENAVAALSQFIDGLGAVDKAGGSSVSVLEDLGLTEIRLSNAVLAMASSEGILSESLNLANNAWNENTALSKEAATRYETTESKLQLLANAADNVKIAVGDQLTPAIGDLADVGADACNWLADFIDQNDAVVPMVTAAAATIGVLAAGITGYTVVTKLATAATEAFSLVMDTNPIFLAVTAVAALAAGIGVLVTTIDNDGIPSVSELTTAADGLSDSMEKASATQEDTVAKTLATASVAETYISRLEELEKTGRKTEEQEKEYHNTLALLCQVVPELSQYIDLQNDSIVGGTEALRANTEAWKQNAIQQAYQETITELQKKHSDVLVEKEMNTLREADATDRATEAEKKHAAAIEESNNVMEWAEQEAQRLYEQTGELVDVHTLAAEKQAELQSAIEQYSEEMVTARNEAAAYQEAIDKDAEAVSAAEEEIAVAEQAIKNLTGATEDNTGANEENVVSQQKMSEEASEVQTRIEELAQAYKDAYEAACNSFEGQFGLFDKASTKTETYLSSTVKNAQAALDSQLEYWTAYDANITTLQGYTADQLGITQESYDALISYISDGSEEAAGLAASMVANIDSGNAEAVANLAETAAALDLKRQEIADKTAQWVVDLDDAIAQIEQAAADADFSGVDDALVKAFADTPVLLKAKGTEAVSGYAEGIDSNVGTVTKSAEGMAEKTVEATSAPLEENGAKIGETYVEDIQSGVESEVPKLVDTVEDVAEKAVISYIKAFETIVPKTKAKLEELKKTVVNTTSSLPNSMYIVGQETINGMIRGLNNRSGALYSTVRSIVNQSIRAAKSEAAVSSPSKKTTEIFEFVGDGMVVGLENRRQKIRETTKSVVDDALRLDVTSNMSSVIDKINASQSVSLNAALASAANSAAAGAAAQHKYYNNYDIKIYQQPGEDEDALLDRLEDRLQIKFDRKEASF